MSDQELLADTNGLLRKLLDLEEQRRIESEKSLREMQERMERMHAESDAALKSRLQAKGLSIDDAESSDEDWEKRLEAARSRAREQAQEAQQRIERHQAAVMQELATQTELLRRIAERLER